MSGEEGELFDKLSEGTKSFFFNSSASIVGGIVLAHFSLATNIESTFWRVVFISLFILAITLVSTVTWNVEGQEAVVLLIFTLSIFLTISLVWILSEPQIFNSLVLLLSVLVFVTIIFAITVYAALAFMFPEYLLPEVNVEFTAK